MLIARDATTKSVIIEIVASSIISNFAIGVSGTVSVLLNAVAVEKARNK